MTEQRLDDVIAEATRLSTLPVAIDPRLLPGQVRGLQVVLADLAAQVTRLEAENKMLVDIIKPDTKPSTYCGHSITYLELRRNDQHMLEVAGCVMCRAEFAESRLSSLGGGDTK